MRRSKLDKIDRKILKNLQNDGRMSNVNLAKDVGISAPPCLRRVRSLEENGYIKGYFADLNASLLGYGVTVFAHVKLGSQAEKDLAAFEQHVCALPMVRECTMLAGETDFLLKVVAHDWDHYQELHAKHLTTAPSVVSVKSSLAIRSSKFAPGVPMDE